MNDYVCKYVCNFERVDLFEVDCTKPAFTYIIVFFLDFLAYLWQQENT